MMTIKTSKGKEYAADWCGVSSIDGVLVAMLHEKRPLHEIAEEFEGCEWIVQDDIDKKHVGYTHVTSVLELSEGMVRIDMRKPDRQEAE